MTAVCFQCLPPRDGPQSLQCGPLIMNLLVTSGPSLGRVVRALGPVQCAQIHVYPSLEPRTRCQGSLCIGLQPLDGLGPWGPGISGEGGHVS